MACSDLQVVPEDIPELDGCPILGRINGFAVPQGAASILEYVFRDENGNPIDISDCLAANTSESISGSESTSSTSVSSGEGLVELRAREILSLNCGPTSNPLKKLFTMTGDVIDPTLGKVRVELDSDLIDNSGVYYLSWGLLNTNQSLVLAREGSLFVERTLFRSDPFRVKGPPTIKEIRLALRDHPALNTLTERFEFDAVELVQAISRPIDEWNSAPPPLRSHTYTTQNFPFREQWLRATCGYLMLSAAELFRRNYLPRAAGGIQINDKQKEGEYLKRGETVLAEWRQFIVQKKMSINSGRAFGSANAMPYGYGGGW